MSIIIVVLLFASEHMHNMSIRSSFFFFGIQFL
jgi:hypothetical protein